MYSKKIYGASSYLDIPKDYMQDGEIEIKSIKQTSIKVDEYTINKFNELCDDYKHINKSYMLSLALKEFYDKYKK